MLTTSLERCLLLLCRYFVLLKMPLALCWSLQTVWLGFLCAIPRTLRIILPLVLRYCSLRFFFFFLLFISWENREKSCFLALFTPKMVFRLILMSARCIFYYCICKNNCSKFSKVLILFTKFFSLADGCV